MRPVIAGKNVYKYASNGRFNQTTTKYKGVKMDVLQQDVLFLLILTVSLVATQSSTSDPVTAGSTPYPEITFPGNFSDENTTGISVEGVFVRILGQSGKFIMGRKSNPSEDPNALKVAFDAIRELNKDGAVIGKSGRVKHSFNTFASQSFVFSNITDDQYQNLSAKRLDFVANLTSVGATLTVQMYLFEEEGNITQNDEVSQVSKGTLKFNMVLENWSFCGMNGETCKQGQSTSVGEYVEFVIAIKGRKSGTKKEKGRKRRTNAQEYDMGGDASVVLSGKARYDSSSEYENLPDGFPKTEMKGSSQLFVFRFRKFNSSVFYDPQLTLDGNDTTGDTTTQTPSGTDSTLTAAQITTKILGKSGKMTIGRGSNPDTDADRVQVTFDEVSEIDSSGAAVGTSRAMKHSFNTFASLDFTFSAMQDTSFAGISAKRLDFTANIASVSAKLTVQVYIFTKGGVISIDGENSTVTAGTVKFNIQIEGWQFCGNSGVTCAQGSKTEIGDGIDFVIAIKGKGSQQRKTANKKTTGEEFELGGGSAVLLSRKIRIDGGNYTDMASGYPKLETRDGKQLFIFRFPKFTSSVLYDPLIVLGNPDTSGANVVTSSLYILITCLMVLITRVLH